MVENGSSYESYRREIEDALETDEQRIGDVYRARLEDENREAQNIADELGLTVGPIHASLGSIRTLIEGRRYIEGPTYAAQKASMLRSFSRRHSNRLSDATIQKLLDLAVEHDKAARDGAAIARENEEIERKTESESSSAVPGIYVYTYPHYMRFPVLETQDEDTNPRTFLKIGRSETDMTRRIKEQNTTSMPEPPLVLRMYTASEGDFRALEEKIHQHLNAADHNQNRKSGAGREWFLTHLQFIDSTAALLGLEIHFAHEAY